MSKKHIHRYILREQGPSKRLIYKCEHRDGACGHYLPATDAIGRQTICWRCGNVCIISSERANRFIKRPHCFACTKQYKTTGPQIDLKKLEAMSIEDLVNDED